MSDYKLTYFNGKGRAEITRLIFAAAGQKYTDERLADWPKGKEDSPLGQLPYLTIDGLKLPQSISIARFVAKRFNLYGSDDLEQAKTDAVVDTVSDLQSGYYQKVFLAKEEDKDAARKSFLAEDAPNHLGKLEKLITLWGSNGHSVGSSLKWSDLFIWDVTNALSSMDANLVAKFPAVLGVIKSVEANQKVSEYVKNRPVTPF